METVFIIYGICFLAGMLAMRSFKAFQIFLILSVPLAWAIAKFAPSYFNVARANKDGFVNFYVKLYQGLEEGTALALNFAPLFFIGGMALFWFYKTFIYVEKVETHAKRKERVRAYYGMDEFD